VRGGPRMGGTGGSLDQGRKHKIVVASTMPPVGGVGALRDGMPGGMGAVWAGGLA